MRRREFHDLLGPSPVPTLLLSATGHILAANAAAAALCGLATKDDLQGRALGELFSDLATSGRPKLRSSGAAMDLRISQVGQSEDRLVLIEPVATTALPRALARDGMVGIFSLAPDLGSGTVPPETLRMIGHAAGSFGPGLDGWRSLLHADDQQGFALGLRALAEGREERCQREVRLRHGDGSLDWYRLGAETVRGGGIEALLQNIDDEKESQRRQAELAKALRRASDGVESLAQNAPGALFEFRWEPNGRTRFAFFTRQLADLLGIAESDLAAEAEAFPRNMPPEDARAFRAAFARSRVALNRLEFNLRVQHPTKGLLWLSLLAKPVARPGGTVSWFGRLNDITHQLEIERQSVAASAAVENAHAQLRTISNLVQVGLFEWRRMSDGSSDFPYANDHLCEMIGVTRDKLDAMRNGFLDLLPFEDRPGYIARREESARSLTPWQMRFRLLHPLKGMVWISGSSVPRLEKDGTTIWTGAIHDATNDVMREEELQRSHRVSEAMRAENERLALHDGLTGLPNRRYYDRFVRDSAETLRRPDGRGPALIRLDLDMFKQINDNHGHEAGDAVLRHVADVLRDTVRTGAFAARIGGDEFSLLLASGVRREDVGRIAECIRRRIAEPFDDQGRPVRLSASFGIAFADDLMGPGDDIQTWADAALYRAKEGGKNRIEVFSGEAAEEIRTAWQLSVGLRAAIERDEFVPYFQPQLCARTGALVGLEVLMRWRHPTLGILAPGHFIHTADQLRLVPEIDRMMMQKTRHLLEVWRRQGVEVPRVSFNVSSAHLHDPSVIAVARDLASGRTKVAFELIESILAEEESETFRRHLAEIRALGIEIEIDDFGSGHASILGLIAIAPNVLKIDRRIIAPIAGEDSAQRMVRMIVDLAGSMDIRTVAEGVETEAQAAILREMGCDVLQGFLFAKPLDADGLMAWLRALDPAAVPPEPLRDTHQGALPPRAAAASAS